MKRRWLNVVALVLAGCGDTTGASQRSAGAPNGPDAGLELDAGSGGPGSACERDEDCGPGYRCDGITGEQPLGTCVPNEDRGAGGGAAGVGGMPPGVGGGEAGAPVTGGAGGSDGGSDAGGSGGGGSSSSSSSTGGGPCDVEVCDGLDNDCDGFVDESANAPPSVYGLPIGATDERWAHGHGGSGMDEAVDVAVLSDGSILAVGSFEGTSTFGATTLVSNGGTDGFLVRYTAAGAQLSVERFGTSGPDRVTNVIPLADGGYVVAGGYGGALVLGAGTPTEVTLPISSPGNQDVFIARYSANGSLIWAKRENTMPWSESPVVTQTSDGALVVAGRCRTGGAIAEGSPKQTPCPASSSGFLARYTLAGSPEWVEIADGDLAYGALAPTSDGGVVAAGSFYATLTLGAGEPNATTMTSAAVFSTDLVVSRHAAGGALTWAKRAGGDSAFNDTAEGVAVAPDGSIRVSGTLGGNVGSKKATFGPGEPNQTDFDVPSNMNPFIARFEPNGSFTWVAGDGGWNDHAGEEVAVFPDGSAVLTGYTHLWLSSVCGNESINLQMFVARFDPGGTLTAITTTKGSGFASGEAIALTTDGDVVVAGWLKIAPATFFDGTPDETQVDWQQSVDPWAKDPLIARFGL